MITVQRRCSDPPTPMEWPWIELRVLHGWFMGLGGSESAAPWISRRWFLMIFTLNLWHGLVAPRRSVVGLRLPFSHQIIAFRQLGLDNV